MSTIPFVVCCYFLYLRTSNHNVIFQQPNKKNFFLFLPLQVCSFGFFIFRRAALAGWLGGRRWLVGVCRGNRSTTNPRKQQNSSSSSSSVQHVPWQKQQHQRRQRQQMVVSFRLMYPCRTMCSIACFSGIPSNSDGPAWRAFSSHPCYLTYGRFACRTVKAGKVWVNKPSFVYNIIHTPHTYHIYNAAKRKERHVSIYSKLAKYQKKKQNLLSILNWLAQYTRVYVCTLDMDDMDDMDNVFRIQMASDRKIRYFNSSYMYLR